MLGILAPAQRKLSPLIADQKRYVRTKKKALKPPEKKKKNHCDSDIKLYRCQPSMSPATSLTVRRKKKDRCTNNNDIQCQAVRDDTKKEISTPATKSTEYTKIEVNKRTTQSAMWKAHHLLPFPSLPPHHVKTSGEKGLWENEHACAARLKQKRAGRETHTSVRKRPVKSHFPPPTLKDINPHLRTIR